MKKPLPIKSAVVLLSGGVDSATLLYSLYSLGYKVHALTVHYGQRHYREIAAAKQIAEGLGVEHTLCDLSAVRPLLKGSSQTDSVAVPEGHYEDPVMRVTVVPNRNMILLSVAAAMAISHNMPTIAYAAHAGDHAVYPDCRLDFAVAMQEALRLCHYDNGVRLLTPYVTKTKAEIVSIGLQIAVPYELTYSCYANTLKPCGKCGTCVERREAFKLCGVVDPVEYQ